MTRAALWSLVLFAATPASADGLPRPWVADASANSVEAGLAIDGDRLTAWRSEGPQTAGDWLDIDLGSQRVVQAVRVDVGPRYATDFARRFAVEVSDDGGDFLEVTRVAALNQPALRLTFNPVAGRYVRLKLTESSGYRWAVAEVEIEGSADPGAINPHDCVVVADGAPPLVRLAARDLRDYLSRATGRYLSLATEDDAQRRRGIKYAVGESSLTEGHLNSLSGFDDEAILMRKVGSTVVLAGNTPRGTAFAVYRFLHRQGVRWYHPGEWGEHVPELRKVDLKGLDIVREPSIPIRWLMAFVDLENLERDCLWALRNCVSYTGQQSSHYFRARTGASWCPPLLDWPYGMYPHSFHRLVSKGLLEQRPDMMPLFDGERRVYGQGNENFCTSSPDAAEILADRALRHFRSNPTSLSFSICPQDGARWCECDRCRALDEPLVMESFSRQDMRNVTDRYFALVNQVAERVAGEFPGRMITTIAYANWHQPPRSVIHPNVNVNLCLYGCSSHAIDDTRCERNREMHERVLGWREAATHLGVYDYVLLNGKHPRTPHPYARSIMREVKWLAESVGIRTWSSEGHGSLWRWSPAPGYLALQMAWDAGQDPEDLLEDFYAHYYGPGVGGAREYWEIMDQRVRDGGVHYGNYNNAPSAEMFTPTTIERLDAALRKAEATAGDNVHARRVGMLRESLDFVTEALAHATDG